MNFKPGLNLQQRLIIFISLRGALIGTGIMGAIFNPLNFPFNAVLTFILTVGIIYCVNGVILDCKDAEDE